MQHPAESKAALFLTFFALIIVIGCRYDPLNRETGPADSGTRDAEQLSDAPLPADATDDFPDVTYASPDADEPDVLVARPDAFVDASADASLCEPNPVPMTSIDCTDEEWNGFVGCIEKCADSTCREQCYWDHFSSTCKRCLSATMVYCGARSGGCDAEWAALSCCMQDNGCSGTNTYCAGACEAEDTAAYNCAPEECALHECFPS